MNLGTVTTGLLLYGDVPAELGRLNGQWIGIAGDLRILADEKRAAICSGSDQGKLTVATRLKSLETKINNAADEAAAVKAKFGIN